eukprot:9617391-Lingulodinium_polyedra.AAC.1
MIQAQAQSSNNQSMPNSQSHPVSQRQTANANQSITSCRSMSCFQPGSESVRIDQSRPGSFTNS